MWYLCSIQSQDIPTVFGTRESHVLTNTPPKYSDLTTIMVGQKQDYTGYLLLSNKLVTEFTKHSSVPEGYDFIFRQSWGLVITEEFIHRIIDTLRAEEYPPIADYLDGIVKNDTAQLQKYTEDCLAVKAKYPKFTWQ